MKLLFNKDNKGQEELKKLLGFLNADIKYENIEPDIELQTPELYALVGKPVYDKIETFYESDQADEGAEDMKEALKNAQLFILLKAYLQYAPNNDLIHGNSGRKVEIGTNQKIPWDWQINMDNGGLERRSYRALDALIEKLNEIAMAEWVASKPYKSAQSLFIRDTATFQNIYPINNSEQLYYRLVPFMSDIETETLFPILGDKVTELKDDLDVAPETDNGQLILYCKKIVVFNVLERASILLPEEMMPFSINYKINQQDRELIREKRAARFLEMAGRYETTLEQIFAAQNAADIATDPLHGVQEDKKYVNL